MKENWGANLKKMSDDCWCENRFLSTTQVKELHPTTGVVGSGCHLKAAFNEGSTVNPPIRLGAIP